MSIWTKAFWRASAERALKTLCQTAAALLVAGGFHLHNAPWWSVLSMSGMAGLLSVLTSIASSGVTKTPGPSMGGGEVLKYQSRL